MIKIAQYIEENLQCELMPQELADRAGYSLFHFGRLFQARLGMPLKAYITQRRLLHAMYAVSQGETMIDAALRYGFDTHAGFYKAFQREFGCAPSAYLKRHVVKKPWDALLFQEEKRLFSKQMVQEVLRAWGLEGQRTATVMYANSGIQSENTLYVGEEYVLKVTSNDAVLHKQLRLHQALASQGLVPAVVPTLQGEEYLAVGEGNYWLTDHLQGEPLRSDALLQGTAALSARELGAVIGRLHVALKALDMELNDTSILQDAKNWSIPETRKQMQLPEAFYQEYFSKMGDMYGQLPRQIIHRDPNPGNILAQNGQLTGILDFDLSEVNVRLFDPCYASTAVLSECFGRAPQLMQYWPQLFSDIVKGYDSVCPLTDVEKRAARYVVYSIQMICVAYFCSKKQFAELGVINRGMLEWLYAHEPNWDIQW